MTTQSNAERDVQTSTFEREYRVEWSYPSSPNACYFGFAKTGCWTVELVTRKNGVPRPPEALHGYATKEEAVEMAKTRSWLAFHGPQG